MAQTRRFGAALAVLALIVGLVIASLFTVSYNERGLQLLGLDKHRTELIVLPWDNDGNTVFSLMPLTTTGALAFLLIVQIAALPCCRASSACACVTAGSAPGRAGQTTVSPWSAASSLAPSLAPITLVRLSTAPLCDTA